MNKTYTSLRGLHRANLPPFLFQQYMNNYHNHVGRSTAISDIGNSVSYDTTYKIYCVPIDTLVSKSKLLKQIYFPPKKGT